MKKSLMFGILAATVLCLGGVVIYDSNNQTSSNVEVSSAQANYKVYHDLSELEQDAELIVLASFTGERENYEVKQGDVLVDTLSKSTIDVKKVYKGEVHKNGKITVF